ncbi:MULTISPECIES: fibronectin type III domain-containing protein [unclassified Lysobacter]|uniref:fibronectin type III domain-containing protein n=1 Tax=unclassified Lysobacter TaxID=2635362 RepID=UPI001BE8FD55|nr:MULTISPECIES: fibronectin type III domain-containing protein [unclassified Lysobacter]MBT2748692.1 fibronectin type III domain-containing protein [Lysobacter sp. ISL-42]MBT2751627.1 fibronectin type III domain-containing protein [Lysobacter sp. ISL-50]MBT2775821.1 fibronectin type III domain-containing protein [Lysobacter sp. ISL-54]MBT2782214.1 fibronectin type III domain-containing protein [Lysobacter sp. ISL-52]
MSDSRSHAKRVPGGDFLRLASLLWVMPALLLSSNAWSAPQDIDFELDCAQQPPHVFQAKVGVAFDSRIELLNSEGERKFWAFISAPTGTSAGARCEEKVAGAEFLCNGVALRLPVGSPNRPVPNSEFAQISGMPSLEGSFSFGLIVGSKEAGGASCSRTYQLSIQPAVIDKQPPTAPAGFVAEFRFGAPRMTIDLSWRAATDDFGVVRYEIQRCDGELCPDFRTLKSVATTRAADSGDLRFDIGYRYRVRAFDRAGNASEFSEISLVQTPAEGPPGHRQ